MQKHNFKINFLLIILAIVVTAAVAYGIVPKRFWNKSTTSSSQGTITTPVENKIGDTEQATESTVTPEEIKTVDNTQPVETGAFTLTEVSKHNNENDCWFVVEGVVYDVTEYISINKHPGGAETVIEGCGKNATELYNTKAGEGKPHSNRATTELETYKVGVLAE